MNQNEALDKILSFAIKHKDEYINAYRLHRDLFVHEDLDILNHLLKILGNYEPKIVYFPKSNDPAIKANGLTERFLQNGGFTEIYNQQQKNLKEEKEYKEKEINKINLEIADLQKRLSDYDKSKRQIILSIIVSIVSAVAALASAAIAWIALRK